MVSIAAVLQDLCVKGAIYFSHLKQAFHGHF